jgi:hypothetical protein
METEYLVKNTEILQAIPVPDPFKTACTFAFVVLAEDMDNPHKVHIHEGRIFTQPLGEIEDDKLREIFAQGFGINPAQYKSGHYLIKLLASKIGVQPQNLRHECVSTGIATATRNVLDYPTNQKRLIVRTLADQWKKGLWIATIQTFHNSNP